MTLQLSTAIDLYELRQQAKFVENQLGSTVVTDDTILKMWCGSQIVKIVFIK